MKRERKGLFRAFLTAVSLAAFLSVQCPAASITVSAHSGRTDARGGHHDYKNKSGLGSYHYHHGYSAHLHPNGVCPYDAPVQNSSASTDFEILDYSPVFDASFYAAANPDVGALYGTDAALLFQHFLTAGMAEGRRGNEEFQVQVYKAENPQLAALFGEDLTQYYLHYCMING